MKKITTILMLLIAIFVAGGSMDAKTPSKSKGKTTKTASSKEFGPSVFLKKGKESYEMFFKSDIGNSLTQMGFKKNGKIYQKNGIKVELYSRDEINITFSNPVERDKFIEKTKSLGYRWNGLENLTNGHFEIDIWVEDNQINMMRLPND